MIRPTELDRPARISGLLTLEELDAPSRPAKQKRERQLAGKVAVLLEMYDGFRDALRDPKLTPVRRKQLEQYADEAFERAHEVAMDLQEGAADVVREHREAAA